MNQAWQKAGEIEKDTFAFIFGAKPDKRSVSKTETDSTQSQQNIKEVESVKEEKEKRFSLLTLLLSTLGSLFVCWRGLRVFGVNPANLMASLSSNFKLREVKAQMSFRHEFGKEFSEVSCT